MKPVKDCNNHTVCFVDESTGYVEAAYKKQTTLHFRIFHRIPCPAGLTIVDGNDPRRVVYHLCKANGNVKLLRKSQ